MNRTKPQRKKPESYLTENDVVSHGNWLLRTTDLHNFRPKVQRQMLERFKKGIKEFR